MPMRTRNPITVLGPDGRPLPGASVYTRVRSTGADATVYAAETGTSPGANPATTDARGRVNQWCERHDLASTITAPGMDPYVEEWESAPAKDLAIDDAWLPARLSASAIVSSTWGQGTLAARPAANAVPTGFEYYANDDWGGSTYRSTGGGNGQTGPTGTGWVLTGSKNQKFVDFAGENTKTIASLDLNADTEYELHFGLLVTGAGGNPRLRLNGDTSNAYYATRVYGYGSGAPNTVTEGPISSLYLSAVSGGGGNYHAGTAQIWKSYSGNARTAVRTDAGSTGDVDQHSTAFWNKNDNVVSVTVFMENAATAVGRLTLKRILTP